MAYFHQNIADYGAKGLYSQTEELLLAAICDLIQSKCPRQLKAEGKLGRLVGQRIQSIPKVEDKKFKVTPSKRLQDEKKIR